MSTAQADTFTSANILVSTHFSSLWSPSQATTRTVPTSRWHSPLPALSNEIDIPAEHACHSSLLFSKETGTVVLRLIHHGLILELISLSTPTNPIRFVFPAVVLPNPAVLLWQERELHILLVTSVGSLYRIVLPLCGPGSALLWAEHPCANWCREYHIRSIPEKVDGIVQVLGTDNLAVVLSNGNVIRLYAEDIGSESVDGVYRWSESIFQQGTFLTSFTSFLDRSGAEGKNVVCAVSHPPPSDITHIWTLSRDRTLRLWTSGAGCVASHVLAPSLHSERESSSALGPMSPPPVPLLDPEPQHLLSVFSDSTQDEVLFVLVFIPTPTSAFSGGYFKLFSSTSKSLRPLCSFECPEGSAHNHLQNFLVVSETLYTLWDYQGQSVVHFLDLMPVLSTKPKDIQRSFWREARYPYEPDLTPSYLDELLLSAGSITDNFFSAIMRPGIFSPLTLRVAIERYITSYLSVPGPHPPQLTAVYSSTAETIASVVGCSVSLTRDPVSGNMQYDKYWTSLKRDWEGFIARCREVERSARWPVALGVNDKGDVLVFERERLGVLATEDLALQVHRNLRTGDEVEEHFNVCQVMWQLKMSLGAKEIHVVEELVTEAAHQEIAYPYPDVIAHMAEKSMVREQLEEGAKSWIAGRVTSIQNLPEAVMMVLNLVGGYDAMPKNETEDAVLLNPPAYTGFSRAIATAYITHTVFARYELCVALVALLFFEVEQTCAWESALLAEILAVFRGISMFRELAEEPAEDDTSSKSTVFTSGTDEVITRMRSLNVSQGGAAMAMGPSLLWHLFVYYGGHADLPVRTAAHYFMDTTGLLMSTTTAEASPAEVLCCERLRRLSRFEVTHRLLEWLPRSPAVMYVRARLWLNAGKAEEAAGAFDSLAGSFGPHRLLAGQDAEALAVVMPDGPAERSLSAFDFYVHARTLFQAACLTEYVIHFARLALSVAPAAVDTAGLWHDVIKGCIDLGYWDDAYAALMATSDDKLRRDCARQLVSKMCEEEAVEKLIGYSFADIADEVLEHLAIKARHGDPRARPSYSRILYSWYISRSDYRNAARVMYQRARKLGMLARDPRQYSELSERQLESYIAAVNALSLLDPKSAWFVIPLNPEGRPLRQVCPLTKYLPEEHIMGGKRNLEYVNRTDIVKEHTLLAAQLEIIRNEPALLASADTLLSPSGVVTRLSQGQRFNTALKTARTLALDMTEIFSNLTRECIRLARNPDPIITENMADWLLTDKVTSWAGSWDARAWRYLREALDQHDSLSTDHAYSKIVFETICGLERQFMPPPWLLRTLEDFHPEWIIRTSMRFEMFDLAIEQALSLLHMSDRRLTQEPLRAACATWLPYTLIDQLLAATADQRGVSPQATKLRKELHIALSSRLQRMQKASSQLH
ncbi:nucleoporin Nup120/160-domain-containing protein [Vararia minispora EC-137]|uniref:Nucleoporin Nup120/160-domain-containing protein n=1 Tax=Vararia minispora EC-137 TaxID=1314806 RepID=A0ACB8QFH7_9AGAM|nr:nucleoporin Nup120/160-domain-containing protein [Vararia minispora EC-137]